MRNYSGEGRSGGEKGLFIDSWRGRCGEVNSVSAAIPIGYPVERERQNVDRDYELWPVALSVSGGGAAVAGVLLSVHEFGDRSSGITGRFVINLKIMSLCPVWWSKLAAAAAFANGFVVDIFR